MPFLSISLSTVSQQTHSYDCSCSTCQWLWFKNSHLPHFEQHIFPKINICISPLPSCLSSSLIYYFLTTPYPFPTSSSLLLTPPSTTASPCCVAKQVSSRAGLMTGGSELAKSTGPEPGQRSWAARAQISPSSEWHWSSPVPWAPAGGEEIRMRGRSRLRH